MLLLSRIVTSQLRERSMFPIRRPNARGRSDADLDRKRDSSLFWEDAAMRIVMLSTILLLPGLVAKLGLAHPRVARPLLHVCNLIRALNLETGAQHTSARFPDRDFVGVKLLDIGENASARLTLDAALLPDRHPMPSGTPIM